MAEADYSLLRAMQLVSGSAAGGRKIGFGHHPWVRNSFHHGAFLMVGYEVVHVALVDHLDWFYVSFSWFSSSSASGRGADGPVDGSG
jgi:hypothetical protein